MLISAEKARVTTHKINDECIEAILDKPIREAIAKGHFCCYITFGDIYAVFEAIAILKEKGYRYHQVTGDQFCYKIEW